MRAFRTHSAVCAEEAGGLGDSDFISGQLYDPNPQCDILDKIYMFQVLHLLLVVLEKLERIFNGFMWGSRPLGKK